MSVADFIYDNTRLSEFQDGKYVMASFSSTTTPTEGQRDITQTSLFMGKEQPFLYQIYSSTLAFTITIIKNPCKTDEISISIEEMEALKRWLCRPAPHIFKLPEAEYQGVHWDGSFNITEELSGSRRIGATLNFISTRPYAVQDDVTYSGTATANEQIIINDTSVELGYLYPEVIITCSTSGDLVIHNDFEDRDTIVKNCTNGETLTFSKYLQLQSSQESHNVYDDFNFKFLRICNNYLTNENVITFSLPCEYTIVYNPIRKVIPV